MCVLRNSFIFVFRLYDPEILGLKLYTAMVKTLYICE